MDLQTIYPILMISSIIKLSTTIIVGLVIESISLEPEQSISLEFG